MRAYIAIFVSIMSGELRLRLLVPYIVVAIIPAMAGIIGGRYFGNAANTCLIIAIFYVASVLLAFFGTGQLRLLPPPGTRSCRPEIWSRTVFILVAIVAYRLRQSAPFQSR